MEKEEVLGPGSPLHTGEFMHPFEQYLAENPPFLMPTDQHGMATERSYSEMPSYKGERKTTENIDHAEEKLLRRKLANRESARRSRQRKQEFIGELHGKIKEVYVKYEELQVKYAELAQNYKQVLAENMAYKDQERNKHGEKMSTPMQTNSEHIQKSTCGEQSHPESIQQDHLDVFEFGTMLDW